MTLPGPRPLPAAELSYAQVRWRWCALALQHFLRRWAVYVGMTALVASAGAVGWQQVLGALAAAFVLPLFHAASQSAWLLLAVPLQALFGALCIWAVRKLLWPLHWAESERALPLPAPVQRRSDLQVLAVALAPLALLHAGGAAVLLMQRLDWLMPVAGRAVLGLLLADALSLWLGSVLLRRLRMTDLRALGLLRRPAASAARRLAAQIRSAPPPRLGVLHWTWVLLVLPLWRGPARRTGQTLLLGTLALLLPALAQSLLGRGEPWWLAFYSLAALALAGRVNQLSQQELTPLLQATQTLPLHAPRLQQARACLGLLAVMPGLLGLGGAVWALRAGGLRGGVLAAWMLACLASCWVEVVARSSDPSERAVRWLFSLVLCVCLASEVLA